MRRGLTLLEMIVAMAIVGVLVAIVLAVYGQCRPMAREAECREALRQTYQAIGMYWNDWSGPPMTLRASKGMDFPTAQCPLTGEPYLYHLEFCSADPELAQRAWAWALGEWYEGCVLLRCPTHIRGGDGYCMGATSQGEVRWVWLADDEKRRFLMEAFAH